jgi:DNA-binding FadR family transcriptional regulator
VKLFVSADPLKGWASASTNCILVAMTDRTDESSLAILSRSIETIVQRRKLGDGGKLPTERELAAELGQTRHAVRRVLDHMEEQGKIWRHVGRGTFVGRAPEAAPGDIGAMLNHTSPRQIVEARQILEPQTAAMAAVNATPAQIYAIEDACRRCAAARNMDTYETWDEAFHRAIVAATGNRVLVALHEVLNRARKEVVWGTLRKAILKPERREYYSSEHARVVEAIRNRDPVAAGAAMRGHIGTMVGIYSRVEEVQVTGLGSITF